MSKRESLFAVLDDFGVNLLFYDRKGDEDLPVDAIEDLIIDGETSIDEIVDTLSTSLRSSLENAVQDRRGRRGAKS